MANRLTSSKKAFENYKNVDLIPGDQVTGITKLHFNQPDGLVLPEARQPQIFVSYEKRKESVDTEQKVLTVE